MNDKYEQIAKLGELRAKGLLTDAEFERQKAELLSLSSATLPPPSSVPASMQATPSVAPPRRSKWKVGCLSVFLFFIAIGAIGAAFSKKDDSTLDTASSSDSSGQAASQSQPTDPQQTDPAWYPSDFTQYDDGIAYRFSKKGEYKCDSGFACSEITVIALEGCQSLYAEVAEIDAAGANIGFSNATTSGLAPLQPAKLRFDILEDATKKLRLSEISCL